MPSTASRFSNALGDIHQHTINNDDIYSLEYGLKRLEDDFRFYEGIIQKEMEKQE